MNKPVNTHTNARLLPAIPQSSPQAVATITGGADHPALFGAVRFYQTAKGVVLWTEIRGLPTDEGPCRGRIFGFHIHAGTDCAGSAEEPFSNTLSHYDPNGCQHPFHAGDLPPLFGSGALALSVFLTDRFTVNEVIGKTVVIHDQPDDFTSQPSGHSGQKIACGVVKKVI